jgi:hypothetical protein
MERRQRIWLVIEGLIGVAVGTVVFLWPDLSALGLLYAIERLLRGRCHATIAIYAGTVDLAKAATAARAALELLEGRPGAEPGLVAEALAARVRADKMAPWS